jgi:hypothetical protein
MARGPRDTAFININFGQWILTFKTPSITYIFKLQFSIGFGHPSMFMKAVIYGFLLIRDQ